MTLPANASVAIIDNYARENTCSTSAALARAKAGSTRVWGPSLARSPQNAGHSIHSMAEIGQNVGQRPYAHHCGSGGSPQRSKLHHNNLQTDRQREDEYVLRTGLPKDHNHRSLKRNACCLSGHGFRP